MLSVPNLYELEEKNGNITIKPFDINKMTICGRNIEKVMQILNGLDLEKEHEMTLTMENLGKWCELIQDDIRKQQEKALKDMFERNNKVGD